MTNSVVLANTIDLGTSGPNWAQLVISLLFIVGVVAFAIVQWARSRQVGTVDEQQRQKRTIRGQLKNASGQMSLLVADMTREDRRRHLLATLPGYTAVEDTAATQQDATAGDTGDGDTAGTDATASSAATRDVPTVRAALRRTVALPRQALPDVDLPPVTGRLLTETLATIILGSLLFVSLAEWRRQLHGAAVGAIPSLDGVTAALRTLLDLVISVATLFPFDKWITVLGLNLVIRTGRWLYAEWILLALVLGLGLVAIMALEHALGDATEDLAASRVVSARDAIQGTLRVGLVVFVAGVLVAGVGRLLVLLVEALPAIGPHAAALPLAAVVDGIGGLVALWVGGRLSRGALKRLRARARMTFANVAGADAGRDRTRLGALVALRIGYAAFSVPVALILSAYTLRLIVTGRLVAVLGLLWTAPLVTKLAFGFLLAVLALVGAVRVRDELREVGSMWTLVLGEKTLAMALFASLGPFIIGIVLAISLTVLGAPALVGVGTGLITMVVLRLASIYSQRGRQWLFDRRRGKDDRLPDRVWVAGFELHDADDRPIHVLRLNSAVFLAHRDPELLAETALTVIAEYFRTDSFPTSVAEHYWTNVQEGLVEWSHTESMVRQEVRRSVRGHLREADGKLQRTTLEEKLDEEAFDHVEQMFDVVEPQFDGWRPESIVDEQLRYLQTRATDIESRQGGDVLVLTKPV